MVGDSKPTAGVLVIKDEKVLLSKRAIGPFIGKIKGGKLKPQEDVAPLHWIDIDKLPLNYGFKNTREALKDLQKLCKARILAKMVK